MCLLCSLIVSVASTSAAAIFAIADAIFLILSVVGAFVAKVEIDGFVRLASIAVGDHWSLLIVLGSRI